MQTIADLRASLAALERHAADGWAAVNAKDVELAAMRASLADRAADAERAVLSSDEWYGLRTVDRTVRSHTAVDHRPRPQCVGQVDEC